MDIVPDSATGRLRVSRNVARLPLSLCSCFDRDGLQQPGYVAAPSGMGYALVFIGRSGEPFPAGVEIHALVPALEPLDEDTVDRDLWAILRWMIAGVGGDWTVRDLEETGRLYRVPAAL